MSTVTLVLVSKKVVGLKMDKEQLLERIMAIIGTLIVAILLWGSRTFYAQFICWMDGRKTYQWLKANTRDEPNQSHKSLLEITSGTRLSEKRIQEACLQNKKIYQSTKNPGSYSIWRVDPQSGTAGAWR